MFQPQESTQQSRWYDSSVASRSQVGIDFIDAQRFEQFESDVQTNDAVCIFFNELDMMFELEGFDKALFHRTIDASKYKTLIMDCMKRDSITQDKLEWNVDVQVAQGDRKDIMVVTVTVLKRYDTDSDFVPVYRQWIL